MGEEIWRSPKGIHDLSQLGFLRTPFAVCAVYPRLTPADPCVSSPRLHFHGCKISASQDSLFYKVKSLDYFAPWPESQSLSADGHSDTFKSKLWNEHFHSYNVSWPMENNESRAVNGSYSSSVMFLQRSENHEMTWKNLGIIWLLSVQQHPQPLAPIHNMPMWFLSPINAQIILPYDVLTSCTSHSEFMRSSQQLITDHPWTVISFSMINFFSHVYFLFFFISSDTLYEAYHLSFLNYFTCLK